MYTFVCTNNGETDYITEHHLAALLISICSGAAGSETKTTQSLVRGRAGQSDVTSHHCRQSAPCWASSSPARPHRALFIRVVLLIKNPLEVTHGTGTYGEVTTNEPNCVSIKYRPKHVNHLQILNDTVTLNVRHG